MWRAGFGPAAVQLRQLKDIEPLDLFRALQKASSKKPRFISAADSYLKGLTKGIQEEGVKRKNLDQADRKRMQQQSRQAIRSLNLMWLNEMVSAEGQLREKMAFFWHGHFASRNLNVFYQQQLLDIIRSNALGNFRDLLHEVSKSAAILNFLNANQNRKDHPNENFAREVMELFTLGRGNYTEQDVKEAARAFTGWGANLQGDFVFRKFLHDFGIKTVLKKTGNLTGEEVLDHLVDQKETARFITQKIYRFFVNDIPDPAHIAWLSDRFYQSNYEISSLMQDIFTSDWFYEEKNIGVRIKSPIELLVGIQRMLPMEFQQEEVLLIMQRLLGQVLFSPPNVAGWPGGRSWIDSSSLMMRLRLPQLFTDNDELNMSPKSDDDQAMGMTEKYAKQKNIRGAQLIVTDIDWKDYMKNFDGIPREALVKSLVNSLLQVKPHFSEQTIKTYSDSDSREGFIQTATIQIMSTPEYQMC